MRRRGLLYTPCSFIIITILIYTHLFFKVTIQQIQTKKWMEVKLKPHPIKLTHWYLHRKHFFISYILILCYFLHEPYLLTQSRIWLWASSGRWWRTVKTDVQQSMGLTKSQAWLSDWTKSRTGTYSLLHSRAPAFLLFSS